MLGGLCVGMGRVYNKTNNVLLSAGILFVAAGERKDEVAGLPISAGSEVLPSTTSFGGDDSLVILAEKKPTADEVGLIGHCPDSSRVSATRQV